MEIHPQILQSWCLFINSSWLLITHISKKMTRLQFLWDASEFCYLWYGLAANHLKNASHELSIVKSLGEDWRCKDTDKFCFTQMFRDKYCIWSPNLCEIKEIPIIIFFDTSFLFGAARSCHLVTWPSTYPCDAWFPYLKLLLDKTRRKCMWNSAFWDKTEWIF